MSCPDFENIRLNRKTLAFPPPVEKLFLQQGMAARIWLLRIGLILFFGVYIRLQFYHVKGFSFLILFFFITFIILMVGYIIEYQARMLFLKSSLLQQLKKETEKKEDLKNNEIFRTKNSLMLEILAHTEAEAQLKQSEEKYRNLVTSLPEGIFIVQDRKIVFVNPGMEKLTGWDADELIGKNVDLLFLKHQISDPGIDILPMDFFIRQNGQKIFIEKSFVEILYGLNPALLFSVRDITEKITATLEKNRLQKELEKAKKMEAFGILAGGVAHDLNNVLSGLSSIPDLLLMDLPKDSHQVEQVKLIKESGRKALSIVDELLTLARGSAKIRGPVQFNSLVEDYLNSLEFMGLIGNYPDVEIVKNYDSGLPLLTASKIHMQKIIMNLISNAVEAVGKKKGRVALETGLASFNHQRIKGYEIIEKGQFLRFTVMDTGHGISGEDMDHIFEPFYSKKVLHRSGTGLGLSIVWNAVHDHKGYIHVSSTKGRTFFTIYFPLPDMTQKTDMKVESSVLFTLSDYSGNNEALLVVEDIPLQQKITSNMLKRLGYKVAAVSSGEEAISYAKTHKIDLVVLDMNLSLELNGYETYEQLLLIDPKIKAIITSGQEMTGHVEKARALGSGEFIKKPFSLQALGFAIKKELNDRETQA